MLETLYSILNLYSILLFIALGIILIWVMLIVSELTLNKYYGYQRFNFSRTYYRTKPNVSSSLNTI